jgi:hypothetical protein
LGGGVDLTGLETVANATSKSDIEMYHALEVHHELDRVFYSFWDTSHSPLKLGLRNCALARDRGTTQDVLLELTGDLDLLLQ